MRPRFLLLPLLGALSQISAMDRQVWHVGNSLTNTTGNRDGIAAIADDRQILLRADGQLFETNGRANDISAAVSERSGGYRCEISIPWVNLGINPGERFSMGFNMAVSDDDDGGDRDALALWKNATVDPAVPAEMGNLICERYALATNILANSSFDVNNDGTDTIDGDDSNNGPTGLAFDDRFIKAHHAGQAWKVHAGYLGCFTLLSGDKTDTMAGFPGRSDYAYGSQGAATGALIQLRHDARSSQGPGFLELDVHGPTDQVQVALYGYQAASGSELNSKLAACVRDQHPIAAGQADATLLLDNLAAEVSESGYQRLVFPVDFGSGYDYLLLGFSATV